MNKLLSRSLSRGAVALLLLLGFTGAALCQTPSALRPAPDAQAGSIAGQPKDTGAKEEDDLERVEADVSRRLLREFRAQNPNARQHKLARSSMGYEEDPSNPALQLESVWVGTTSVLFEITGFPRKGKPNSAVIRRDTLRVAHGKGVESNLVASEGVLELRDRRGGAALVVKPGEKLYLVFDAIDDMQPFTLFHVNRDGSKAIYFDDIDPRFRERYDAAFAKATTPEGMKDFLVAFAKNDPDGRAPRVFAKLINEMRAQKTFEGYYTAYLLLEDVADAKQAQRVATSDDHRRKLEHVAITALADKSRLLDFDVKLSPGSTTSGEGRCWMFCRYNFTGSRNVNGTLTVKARTAGSPIRLRQSSYRVSFISRMVTPVQFERRSGMLGNESKPDQLVTSRTHTVTLSAPDYAATLPISFGSVDVAFFQRGSAGGWEAKWATGDPQVTVSFRSMDLMP